MLNTIEKTKPTRSQVETLMSDWLGNLREENDNFTHKGKKGIQSEETVIDYLIGKNADRMLKEDLMRKSRQAAEQVALSVVSNPVQVQIGGDMSYHTAEDGKHQINLASDFFDDDRISGLEKAEILLGLASHEAAHAVYTDSEQKMERLLKEPEETVQLKKDIWNTIEDERIEYLLGEERPGLSPLLGKVKKHYFAEQMEQLTQDLGKDALPNEPLPRFLIAFQNAVRYPSELTRDMAEEMFDELDTVRQILTPYPMTNAQVWEATEKVMETIRDLMKKQMEQQKEKESQDGNGSSQKGGASNSAGGSGSGGSGKGKEREPSKKEVSQAIKDALSSKEGQSVMKAIHNAEQKADPKKSSHSLDENTARYVNDDSAESFGDIRGGAGGDSRMFHAFRPKGNAQAYAEALRDIRALVPAMARSLSCRSEERDYVVNGQRSGKMNMNKLVSYRCGNTNIFTKQGSVHSTSASVCLLIDESGSMWGNELLAARRAAILVNEAVKKISNVDFFCYGYTTRKLNIYRESSREDRFSLGSTEATGGTPTGWAMETCASRVRKHTKEHCVMLVVTDGAAEDPEKVKKMVTELKKRNFSVVGIGIGDDSSIVEDIPESTIFRPTGDFPLEIGRIVKRKLNKHIKRINTGCA